MLIWNWTVLIDQSIEWHEKALKMDPNYEYPKKEIKRLLAQKTKN